MFSTYCGLALHHAKLYEKIRRSEQKYRVSLEVLSYHNASSVDEVETLVAEGLPNKDDDLQKWVQYEFMKCNRKKDSTNKTQLLKLPNK